MKKKIWLTGGVLCAGVLMASTTDAMWPTFDVAKVMESIETYKTTMDQMNSTKDATQAIGDESAAIGDSSQSQAALGEDDETKKKKEQEKKEKKARAAARLAKMKKKYKQAKAAYEVAKTTATEAKKTVDETKATVAEVKETAEAAEASAKDALTQAKKTASEFQNKETSSSSNDFSDGADVFDESEDDLEESDDLRTNDALFQNKETSSSSNDFSDGADVFDESEDDLEESDDLRTNDALTASVNESTGKSLRQPFISPVSALDMPEALYMSWNQPMASAKETPTMVSGSTEDGTFVVSDTLASECGFNVDDTLTEDQVGTCMETWLKGMNDKSQSEQAEWADSFQQVTDEFVAANLAEAMANKQSAATFSETTAVDLEQKASAVNTVMGSVAYNSVVARTNQDLILKLMGAQASQVISENWKNLKLMGSSYVDLVTGDDE